DDVDAADLILVVEEQTLVRRDRPRARDATRAQRDDGEQDQRGPEPPRNTPGGPGAPRHQRRAGPGAAPQARDPAPPPAEAGGEPGRREDDQQVSRRASVAQRSEGGTSARSGPAGRGEQLRRRRVRDQADVTRRPTDAGQQMSVEPD